jgi:peptidoglycan L-alanyl-D-glutamate endopeptidase CwlK
VSDRTEQLLNTLDPAMAWRALEMVNWLREQGVPLVISSARRSRGEQQSLWEQGRPRPGPIVTNTLNSKHVLGLAFDVDVQGWRRDALPGWFWEYLNEVGQALGLTWGGKFTRLSDKGHFEI